MARMAAQVDHAIAHHAAVEQQIRGRHQPVADVVGEDVRARRARSGARGRDPTRRDRRRPRRRRLRPARRRGRWRARACSRRRGRRRYIGCSGSIASGTPAAAHGAAARRCRRAPARRAPPMSLRALRQAADDEHEALRAERRASSTARRLSSSAARRPASSAAGNMPPRHRPVTVRPCARMSLRGALDAAGLHACRATARCAECRRARSLRSSCSQRPRLHRRGVDRRARA